MRFGECKMALVRTAPAGPTLGHQRRALQAARLRWSRTKQRGGHDCAHSDLPGVSQIAAACAFANRTLGFVNAPALWQLVIAETADACVDVAAYEKKRDLLCDGLARVGYDVRKPEGGYFVFLKTPIPDDVAFVSQLLKQGVLAVPGVGFGRAGYIRLSITASTEVIERSLPAFERALG